ncbi:TadE/TadG family type IV pilus assembly protein [Thermoanaerobacterium thermosaccharolyticum]|uniref:TadE/TadG family type IV pilus assembly protein n=1 Tax=Thermoanaerobacterium thermosaccharolyticum TaxID=1517 RepID=UPI003DA955C0
MLKDKKGVSNVITLAILVPVLLVLVFGIVMGGQISNVRSVTEEASRAGARWLSEHPGDITGAKQKASQVVEESFTVPEGISDPDLKDKLVGKLTYVNNRFYINGQYVKPANSDVQQTLSSLVNSYVAAGGSYINPQTFQATVATTDPPETQSWTQTNFAQQSNTTQTVGPTSHSGTYPAYYIAKYGGGPWGTNWITSLVSTNGSLHLQTTSHNSNIISSEWTSPYGVIQKIHIKGKSERNYDYGYVEGWNGSSWIVLARECSPAYETEYDKWIDVSGKNIKKIRTRLTTDDSVLYSPTYVDVLEVQVVNFNGWSDNSAWWIWGGTQVYSTHAISGQEVKLTSPPFYTEAYAKYTVSGVCDNYFSAYIDSTNIFNGNGSTVQQWQWIRPGAGYHQAWMTGGNYYGPAGFLFSVQKTDYKFLPSDSKRGSNVFYDTPGFQVSSPKTVIVSSNQPFGIVSTDLNGQWHCILSLQDTISINGALYLQTTSHNSNIISSEWTSPYGVIQKIHIKGKSEMNYDYGYVEGWNGSSWIVLDKECSPAYKTEYDKWIDVSGKNIKKIRTRLTTDDSVLYSPTYVDVLEVQVQNTAGIYSFTAYPGVTYYVETETPASVDITYNTPETLINTGTTGWTYQPVNGIGYGNVTLPTTAEPNSSFNVTVPITNLTNATWYMNDNSYSGATYLSYHWYDANGNKVMDGDISRLSNDLPPNGSCNIPMTIKTPSTSGKYRLVIDGEQQDTAWFGTENGVNWNTIEAWITIGNTYGIQYNSVDVPKYMEKGKTYNISVTVKNTGSIPWTSGTFGMAYHWYSNNTCVLWDGARDYVKTTVQPGQSYTFNVPVKALSNAGSYTLQFDMVQEGVTWFSQKNFPVVNATVQIPDGDVLKGTLTYDGDYWINDTLVQQGQCDLSRLIGQNVILWGENTGQTEIYIVTDVSKYNPNQDTISTFDPVLDVYCNDTVSPDPDHPDDTTVNFKRTDGYAYCRVVYHYPTPIRNFWNTAAKRNMFYSSQPLFINIGGESFFKEATQ